MVYMPYPRTLWSPPMVLKVVRGYRNERLTVVIGANDPFELMEARVCRLARKVARSKGFRIDDGASDIKTYGQNCLAERYFYYKKPEKNKWRKKGARRR